MKMTLEEISKPKLSILVKLGSIAVHADELSSPQGHQFDKAALTQLLEDPEIELWMKEMKDMGLLPVKRR